jgi:hypothetical protein
MLSDGREPSIPFALLVDIAVPHLGADLAVLATALGISADLLSDLKRDSNYLKGLRVRWGSGRPRPRTVGVSSPEDHVVDQASAQVLVDTVRVLPGGGHIDVVKPDSRTDARYVIPIEELFTVVQNR